MPLVLWPISVNLVAASSQVTSGMIHDLKKGLCQGTRKDLTIHELLRFFSAWRFLEAGKFRWGETPKGGRISSQLQNW